MGACCVCFWARMFLLEFHSRRRDARPWGPRFSLPTWLAVRPLPLPGWPNLVRRDILPQSVYILIHHEYGWDGISSLLKFRCALFVFLFFAHSGHLSFTVMSLLYLLPVLAAPVAQALRYDPAYAEYNLNTNQQAVSPLDYSGERNGHTYHPSPDNWRFPFYTVMLDKWVNGDPSNDNANGTLFEQDIWSTQLRHGGDIQGLVDSLDYIQGMGIKVCSY